VVRLALPGELVERGAQALGERPRGVAARHPDVGFSQEWLARIPRHGGGDDDGELGADLLLLVLELSQPRRLPGLGLLRFPEDRAAEEARGRAHALDEVGAVHAFRHGQDLVERERRAQERFQGELERLALELLRTLLELALEIRRLALRGLDLRFPLRLAAAGFLARLRLDFLALGVEAPLVFEVLVLLCLLELAELAAKAELLVAEIRRSLAFSASFSAFWS
jgi:hypothetical protein